MVTKAIHVSGLRSPNMRYLQPLACGWPNEPPLLESAPDTWPRVRVETLATLDRTALGIPGATREEIMASATYFWLRLEPRERLGYSLRAVDPGGPT